SMQVDGAAAQRTLLVFAGVGGAAMLLGLADDRYSPTIAVKLAGQIACASVFVWLSGPLASIPVPFAGTVFLGDISILLTMFWIVAFMNAFNFMDGANGVAATTGIIAAGVLAIAAASFGALAEATAALMLAFAIAGFLRENFPHGRLFMGDAGSQFIGFALAALGVSAANATAGALSALFAPTLAMAFLFDVAFTLFHRARRGAGVGAPHREHVYQLLMRGGASHVAVAAIYVALTALSVVASVWMLRLAPGAQWIAPAALAAAFVYPALKVYRNALDNGLLAANAVDRREQDAPSPIAQAAE
ncbi:MAG: MraY family glycosyltransferase, partial [Pseudomonadota bacterium]